MDVITGVVVVGVIIVGYLAFKPAKTAVTETVTGSSSAAADQVVTAGAEVAGTVHDLSELSHAVEQSVALFAAPTFTNLQDYSAQVVPEPVGRANPFIPTDWKRGQNLSK